MNCPQCGDISRVINLERRADGSHRWRRCVACGCRFRSLEVIFKPAGPRCGEDVHWAVLTEDNVRDIRNRFQRGETLTFLSDVFGVHRDTIRYIVQRKSWKHVA